MVAPRLLCLLLLVLVLPQRTEAQAAPAAAPAAASAKQSPPPAPVPIADIAAQSETLDAHLREIEAAAADDTVAANVEQELPGLTREIDLRLDEHRRILAQQPAPDTLRALDGNWRRVRESLTTWSRELTRTASRMDRALAQLAGYDRTWTATRTSAPPDTPPEVLARIDAERRAVARAAAAVDRSRARVLALQGRVAAQDARVGEALSALRAAREDMVSRLLVKDSPAIWTAAARRGAGAGIDEEARLSLSAQLEALRGYVERRPAAFIAHALVLALVAACFYWARREVRRWLREEPDLRRTALVFETPVATALVLSLFAIRSLYPEAPRLLWACFGALSLLPTALILRRLLDRHLRPALYALVAFYFVDQVRAVVAALQLLPRLLFLAEMAAAALFAWWLAHSLHRARGGTARDYSGFALRAGALAGLALCAASLLANAAGYVRLANLLGDATLASAYFALILYVVAAILDGLLTIALRVRPLRLLGMVQRHRVRVRLGLRRAIRWLAAALWLSFALDRLTVRDTVFAVVRHTLTAQASVGSLHLSLGDVLAFVATLWAAVLFSHLVRFLLEEDVYPRVHLARGLPYAISTMAHYVILVVGFFAAVAALGLDMTKATILAGAFTVGVGFGLQNIFNNFVSGLILLFERPVKVGDVIEMDADSTGVVERIGIRASVIRTYGGAELIVPNGKLISDRFTNWTFSSRSRSIEVPVSIGLASDAAKAIATLERIAAEHPLVVKSPAPKAIVTRLGPDWMGLELRAWTDQAAEWMQIRSELAVKVSQGLAAAGIALR